MGEWQEQAAWAYSAAPKPLGPQDEGVGAGPGSMSPGLGAGGSLTSTGVWLPMATWVRQPKTTPQLSEPSSPPLTAAEQEGRKNCG